MNWQLVGRTLRLIFLLRVPLLTLFLLGSLGPISRDNSLLDNLFDQGSHPLDVAMVSFAAFLLSFTAIATLNLTLHYGSDRLDEHRTFPMSQRRPLLTFILGTAAAVIFVATVVLRTEYSRAITVTWTIVGALCAFALVIVAKAAQLALTDPVTTPHPPPFLVFPAYLLPGVERWLDGIYCWSSPASGRLKNMFSSLSQWPLRVLRGAGQGYLVHSNPPPGTPLKLLSGHVFALTLSIIAFAFYLVIGLSKRHITAGPAAVPALAYLLLFGIVACWFIAALAFFFDRYRFPLLTAIALLALITAQAPKSDHFFRVEKKDISGIKFLKPADYLRERLQKAKNQRLIFVATPGGGIQAAAWTAEVLQQLSERPEIGPDFRNSVALISSVSGGSLGSMIYAASYTGQVPEKQIIANSRESAIDEVGWGWTFADFWRAATPWFGNRTVDRGWALEEKWAAVNNLSNDGRNTLLSDWAAQGANMPALIFNSMLVEPGTHVIFSNTAFPQPQTTRGIVNFYNLYPEHGRNYDIPINTVVRLSASFPYVAPASRPDLDSMYAGDYHFVDGGYYDNYGIDSLIGWLGEALDDKAGSVNVKDVLILTIRHFNAGNPPTKPVRGWGFQLYAPLSGLLAMWNSAPARRDANEFALFADRISKNPERKVWIVSIGYEGAGACAQAPLSWKLSESQKTCIDDSWKAFVKQDALEKDVTKTQLACLDTYLRGGDDPACQHPSRRLQ